MSRLLGRVSTVLFWATPFACALFWAYFNGFPDIMKSRFLVPGRLDLLAMNRALCFVANMLPAVVAMYGFRTIRELFGLYAAGEIFSRRNVSCYRALGKALLYWAGAAFLNTPLLSLAMSAGMPAGQRHITVSLGSDELAALFAGAAALVISWVMDEGRHIEEEQALTI
ncbi:DUF2975 domain-containing protein [Fundidesulfovibrio terrae]|uniref:DUF2975 domain-containing protein n=1 Tax=Fundidesulfovibrio terrae TaxID=2922866 RepID=UPI001FAFA981|nr:DUF2975 domain-containing protein [Fundidesulfovibrio terrae]